MGNVRAAISYFSNPKNAAQYPQEKQQAIWGRIKAAAKKFGVEVGERSGPPSVEKSMGSEKLVKCLVGYEGSGGGTAFRGLDWAGRFAGTPHHRAALELVKRRIELQRENEAFEKTRLTYQQLEEKPGPERTQIQKEESRKRAAFQKRSSALNEQASALEEKIVDDQIAQAGSGAVQKGLDLPGVSKSLTGLDGLGDYLEKAGGPYIGPKGGKWADPQHKHAWKELGKTSSGKPVHEAAHEDYNTKQKVKGAPRHGTALYEPTVMRQQFPQHTKQDHAEAAKIHQAHADKSKAEHTKLLAQTIATHGSFQNAPPEAREKISELKISSEESDRAAKMHEAAGKLMKRNPRQEPKAEEPETDKKSWPTTIGQLSPGMDEGHIKDHLDMLPVGAKIQWTHPGAQWPVTWVKVAGGGWTGAGSPDAKPSKDLAWQLKSHLASPSKGKLTTYPEGKLPEGPSKSDAKAGKAEPEKAKPEYRPEIEQELAHRPGMLPPDYHEAYKHVTDKAREYASWGDEAAKEGTAEGHGNAVANYQGAADKFHHAKRVAPTPEMRDAALAQAKKYEALREKHEKLEAEKKDEEAQTPRGQADSKAYHASGAAQRAHGDALKNWKSSKAHHEAAEKIGQAITAQQENAAYQTKEDVELNKESLAWWQKTKEAHETHAKAMELSEKAKKTGKAEDHQAAAEAVGKLQAINRAVAPDHGRNLQVLARNHKAKAGEAPKSESAQPKTPGLDALKAKVEAEKPKAARPGMSPMEHGEAAKPAYDAMHAAEAARKEAFKDVLNPQKHQRAIDAYQKAHEEVEKHKEHFPVSGEDGTPASAHQAGFAAARAQHGGYLKAAQVHQKANESGDPDMHQHAAALIDAARYNTPDGPHNQVLQEAKEKHQAEARKAPQVKPRGERKPKEPEAKPDVQEKPKGKAKKAAPTEGEKAADEAAVAAIKANGLKPDHPEFIPAHEAASKAYFKAREAFEKEGNHKMASAHGVAGIKHGAMASGTVPLAHAEKAKQRAETKKPEPKGQLSLFGGSMKKSLSGLDGLGEFLKKADAAAGLPTGEPTLGGSGAEQGGTVAGRGKVSGDPSSGPSKGFDKNGKAQGTPAVKTEKLSDDDEDVEDQLKNKAPTPLGKSMTAPAHQREMVAHAQAQAVSRLQRGPADVRPGLRGPAPQAAPEALQKADQWTQGKDARVIYSNASDRAVEELLKADPFYTFHAPTVTRDTLLLHQVRECGACGGAFAKSLAACPHCGVGALDPTIALHGHEPIATLEKSLAPRLRPAREPADLYFPNRVTSKG